MCTQRNTNNSKCDILGPSERVRHITAGVLQKRISPIWLLCISGLAVGLAVPQLSKGSGAGFILTNKCPPSPQEENPTSFPPAAAFDVCLFNDIIGSQSSVLGGVLVQRRVRGWIFIAASCILSQVVVEAVRLSEWVQCNWFGFSLVNCFCKILRFDFSSLLTVLFSTSMSYGISCG